MNKYHIISFKIQLHPFKIGN